MTRRISLGFVISSRSALLRFYGGGADAIPQPKSHRVLWRRPKMERPPKL